MSDFVVLKIMNLQRFFFILEIDGMHYAILLSDFLSGLICFVHMDVAEVRFCQK